jgi:hypothetical protein
MTNLSYFLMFVGFALWFWAGYSIGKKWGFAKFHKQFCDIISNIKPDKLLKND